MRIFPRLKTGEVLIKEAIHPTPGENTGGSDMTKAMMITANAFNDQRYLSNSEVRIRKNKMRRNRIVLHQRIMLAAVIAVLLWAGLFIVFTLKADASVDAEPMYKYYKVITVQPGDTLYGLASKNMSPDHYRDISEYEKEVACINHLSENETIYAGTNLVLPYYSSEYLGKE